MLENSLIKDVPIFKWKDLSNKVLKIIVYEEDGARIISGYDVETGIIYILDTEKDDSNAWEYD